MEPSQQLPAIWRSFAEAVQATGLRLTLSALEPGRSGARLDDLVRRLHKELDAMVAQAFDALPGGGPACTAGCDHCCRTLRVTASPIEVFVIGRRLRSSRLPDAHLEERLAASRELGPTSADHHATGDEETERRTRHGMTRPCPLLAEGLCLVYSSRPFACRGCVSADASLCAACDDDRLVPRSTAHQLGASAMAAGVTQALASLGLAGDPVEFRAALVLALADEDAEKRWLRGEDVFAEVVPAA